MRQRVVVAVLAFVAMVSVAGLVWAPGMDAERVGIMKELAMLVVGGFLGYLTKGGREAEKQE